MNCVHGRPFGAFCPHCHLGVAQVRGEGTVIVPPYAFRPFEPVDSTVYPYVVTPEGAAAAVPTNVVPGLRWAPPPAVMFDRSQSGGPTLMLDSTHGPA